MIIKQMETIEYSPASEKTPKKTLAISTNFLTIWTMLSVAKPGLKCWEGGWTTPKK